MVPELLTTSKTLLLHLGPPSLLPVPTGLNLMSHNSKLSIFQYFKIQSQISQYLNIQISISQYLKASATCHRPHLHPTLSQPPPSAGPSPLPLNSPRSNLTQKILFSPKVGGLAFCVHLNTISNAIADNLCF